MERDANYVAVGAFILIVIAMGVGFIVWYTDASDGREYDLYEIYFAGSVSGLDRGSPVRYLGVDVGRVRKLSIDRNRPGRVAVLAEVDRTAPISSATRASLGLQGVTGLLYIDLKEVPEIDTTQPLKQGDHYPVIASVASDFDTFLASMPELLSRANSVLERVGRVLSDQNLVALTTTMANLRDATAGLPATSRNVAELVEQMRGTVAEIHGAAESLSGMAADTRPEIRAAIQKIGVVADNLAQASQRIDQLTQKSEAQVGHFAEYGLFEMERLVRETRSAAREFRDLSRSLQDNPSQILYEPPQSGVEIAK
jgi:phospholipid/cholesterol/gamma-HCH transport system substrate-binding protein